MDPLLREIYSKETASHVAELRDYLRQARRPAAAARSAGEPSTGPAIRLSGSSNMAEARHGIRLAEPLNH